jgi:hypothetical protein
MLYVPFPVHRVRNSLGRMPSRIMVTKATVARQHVRNALLDRVVMAVPYYVASADVYHRAPRCIPIGLNGWNVEAKCRRQGGDREHQSNDSFHRDSPDIWRASKVPIVGSCPRLRHSMKRSVCPHGSSNYMPPRSVLVPSAGVAADGSRRVTASLAPIASRSQMRRITM